MNSRSLALLADARAVMADLSHHAVLERYWPQLSLVLKGSTARGNTDEFSDIDLVFFSAEDVRQAVVAEYFARGLTSRQDGIFMFIPNGHYHIESYDQLSGYFRAQDFVHAWDYAQAIPLHDAGEQYAAIVSSGLAALFANPLALIKRAYLDLQLDLDWMRMPIMRADGPATLLHSSKLLAGIARLAYLLEDRPYPPDKWLFFYLDSTTIGQRQQAAIEGYFRLCPLTLKLERGQRFESHPLYAEAENLIVSLAEAIRQRFGDQPWLERWYDFV
jgi:hypothetical protein